jgi:hypothetical protein
MASNVVIVLNWGIDKLKKVLKVWKRWKKVFLNNKLP